MPLKSKFFTAYTSGNESEVSEQLYNEMKPAVEGANYIVKHMHDKNDYNEVRRQLNPVNTLQEMISSFNPVKAWHNWLLNL